MDFTRNLSRHPILVSIYEAALAVEACGASPELTRATTLVSALMDQAHDLLDTIPATTGQPCTIDTADFKAGTVLLKMEGHFTVRAGAHMLVSAVHVRRDAKEMIRLPVIDMAMLGSIETSETEATPLAAA